MPVLRHYFVFVVDCYPHYVSVIILCFVVRYFVPILDLQSS